MRTRTQRLYWALIPLFAGFCMPALEGLGRSSSSQQRTQSELLQLEQKREACEKFQAVLTALDLAEGKQVADVGAGDGFYTIRIAHAVGLSGRVFAVEISQRAIDVLRERVEQNGAKMIVPVLGSEDNPRLPQAILDAALIVNSYHEMKKYQSMLQHIRRALKPTGLLVIVEPISPSNRNQTRDVQITRHEIGSEFVAAELVKAAFQIVERRDPFVYRDKSCGKVASHNTDVPDWWMIVARASN